MYANEMFFIRVISILNFKALTEKHYLILKTKLDTLLTFNLTKIFLL